VSAELRALAVFARDQGSRTIGASPDVILALLDERDAAIRRAEELEAALLDPLYGTRDEDKDARLRFGKAMQRAAEKNARGAVYVTDQDVHSLLFELRSENLALRSQESQKPPETEER